MGVRGRGNGTSHCLEDETNQVACAEDKCVRAGRETRKVCAIDDHDSGEAEVDGSTQQRRGDSKCDEVHEEVVVVEWRAVK